ncbi:MAG: hypothetical protein K2K63_03140 [Acetatifactor sp.]|nr:hypothetical protein [Acetatifactor sp.]
MDNLIMNEKQKEFTAWLGSQIAACEKRREKLLADERSDESDFEKIKANIYDIFRTVFTVALKTGNGDTDTAIRFFLLKAEEIPANWKAAYEKAKQHNDVHKMQIESLKLETMQDIKTAFERIWEVEA